MNARTIAGILVLVALALFGVLLIPCYYHNWQLQCVLDDTVAADTNLARPAEMLKVDVANQAARLGLPVRTDQVKVVQGPARLKLQADYFVRIDLALYTVDLHFHPEASR